MWETWEIDKKGDNKEKGGNGSAGGKWRNRHFLVLSLVFHMQFNLSFRGKINLWWQSTGQEWKQRSSSAMGKFLLENAANLGKMNHSHFIWTSVLAPPSSSSSSWLSFICDSFITRCAGGCSSGAQKKNAAWRRSNTFRSFWCPTVSVRTCDPHTGRAASLWAAGWRRLALRCEQLQISSSEAVSLN